MKMLERDDFILAKPKKVIDGKIKVSSEYWPSIDSIFVKYTDDATLSKPFTARVKSVERGKVTATPVVVPGSDMVSLGEKVKVCMNRNVNGVPTASTLAIKNLSSIYVPGSELGALVSAQVYHIRSKKADAELIEIIESGIGADEAIRAKIERGKSTAITNDDRIADTQIELDGSALVGGKAYIKLTDIGEKIEGRIDEYDFIPKVGEEYTGEITRGSTEAKVDWPQKIDVPLIALNKPALVDGKACIKLTKIGEKIEGSVEEYGFIPKVREKYSAKVTQGTTEAEVDWPQKIGVPSVKLDYPAEATMDATVEITDVGGEVRGRIVGYDSIPDVDKEIRIKVNRGNSLAHSRSGSYSVKLESGPVASGKATAVVKKKSLPVIAKITEYDVVSEGDVVGAKIPEGPTNIAQPYSGTYEIILDEGHEAKKYLKVRILEIDESSVYGTVVDVKRDFSSGEESTSSRNPFESGNSSKNDLISGRQL